MAMQMLAPDIATQQSQLTRQQQMADLLRQQSMQPLGDTQTVGGWAIKRSPWESVNKLAQALGATYMQKGADEKQLGLAKAMQERMGTAFDGMAGGSGAPQAPVPMPAAPQAQGIDPMQMTEGAQAAPAPQQPPAQPAQLSQVDRIRNQAKAAYMMGNTELANKLLENISTMTEGQRTDNYLGISADQSRQAELAKRLKEGTMSLQPGQTNVMPDGSRMVAPNFETGVAGGFNSQGMPVASAIPGSTQIAAERAGAVAGATSGANAQNEMVSVNIGGRPVMMTKAQAVQMSGGAPQGGTHFANPDPAGMSLNFQGDPQATFDKISKIADPAIRAQAMQAMGQIPAGPQGGAPAPAGGIGIAGSTPAEDAQRLADVQLRTAPQLAQKTQEYKDMADYGKTLDGHVSESQALLQRVAESREALTKFKAGGGAETRAKLASMAQAFGMPDDLVNKIAGGDLAAAQVFQKFAAQEALGTMQQALASDSGKGAQGNRISMDLFIKNNPNIGTDPNAIEKVFNFITKQAQQSKAQQDAYHQYKENPKNDPSNFPAYWAGEAIKRGYVTPEISTGKALGTIPAGWKVEVH